MTFNFFCPKNCISFDKKILTRKMQFFFPLEKNFLIPQWKKASKLVGTESN